MKVVFAVFIFLFPLSCNTNLSSSGEISSNNSIPHDTIRFEYDNNLMKLILFDGILNDTIKQKVLFDTAWNGLTISDNLAGKLGENISLQIGNIQWDSLHKIRYLDKNNGFFKTLGANATVIDWEFFAGKIIKISYQCKFLQILNNLDGLKRYDSIKIKLKDPQMYLAIPITVCVQGKEIKERVLLDTGNNGDVTFNYNVFTKYNINEDGAYYGKSKDVGGFQAGFSLPADTIKVGKYFVTRGHYVTFHSDKGRELPFAGIIGNKFFENFDIVLDLKNYYLYLKPIDN